MSLVRLHKWLCYALLLLPFGVLWLGGEMSPAVSLVFLAGLGVSWFWEPPRVDVDRWTRLLVLATFGILLLTVLRVIRAGGFDIAPLVDLVLLLTVIKAMQRRHPGDYAQLLALSFLLMAASSAYNQGLLFAVSFAVYLVAGTIALAVKHLREELTRHHPAELERYRPEGGLLATVAGLSLVVFGFSLVFFVVFPRMGFGLFNMRARSGLMTSGFSESVSLGEHGRVRDDDTVVMRVRFPDGPAGSELRWRGTSFDTYDGTTWLRRHVGRESAFVADSGLYVDPRSGLPDDRARFFIQDIYLEPIDSDVLFGMPIMRAIDFPDEDRDLNRSFFREFVRVTRRGEFYLDRRSTTGVHYRVWSERAAAPAPDATWPGGVADYRERSRQSAHPSWAEVEDRYLQRPANLTSRFASLAAAIVTDAERPLARARAIESYLRSEYDYTTDLPVVSRDNPIESFLFDTRRGHCEYFATAMVLLAREVGLPARNVNGFLGGDWNGIGGFYAVRQSHAHSWVEVLLPGAGWVTFDPTPASGLPPDREPGLWASVGAFFDSIRMLWYRFVVDYDLEQQLGAVRAVVSLFGEGDNLAMDLRSLAFATFRNTGVIAVGLLLWLLQLTLLARRHRTELPWSRLDWVIGLAPLVVVELLVLLFWRPEPTVRAFVMGGLLPALTCGAAWATRRRSDRRELGPRRRRRGRLPRATRTFLKLVQTLSRRGYDYRAGDVPSALVCQARERRVSYAGELSQVVRIYQRCRFAGSRDRRAEAQLDRRVRALRRMARREAGRPDRVAAP